jgi:hypothetical protein
MPVRIDFADPSFTGIQFAQSASPDLEEVSHWDTLIGASALAPSAP